MSKKIELYELTAVEIYKMVLTGKLKRFPCRFWTDNDMSEYIEIIKFLIEDILKWSNDDIKEKLGNDTFIDNGLTGMLRKVFGSSPYKAINTAYPGKFHPWELRMVPRNYWNLETAGDAVRWFIEEKLQWSDNDIKKNLTLDMLYENGFATIMQKLFSDSPYKALNNAYPDMFKPWDMKMTAMNYWNKSTAAAAAKWLIEEKLKWTDDDIKKNLTQKVFIDNNLGGMIKLFDSSTYQVIDTTYPGKFKPWEFVKTFSGYWNEETSIDAVKWMIEEKLKWSDDDVKRNLTQKVFNNNNLGGMLATLYKNSPFVAINTAYPGKFKPWELKQTLSGYWNKETAIAATKWMIEEKLNWSDDEVRKKLSNKVFYENNLCGMLKIVFNNSAIQAIKATYPKKYKKLIHSRYL
jgi:hypothetical protein